TSNPYFTMVLVILLLVVGGMFIETTVLALLLPPILLPVGGLPPFRGHGGCLRCEREFIGVGAFVGVRGQVAAPGVAALGVVAGQPAEHLSTAGLLVGEACGVSEDLALRRRVEGLRHRVVGAGADGSH